MELGRRLMGSNGGGQRGHCGTDQIERTLHVDNPIAESADSPPPGVPYAVIDLMISQPIGNRLIPPQHSALADAEVERSSIRVHSCIVPGGCDTNVRSFSGLGSAYTGTRTLGWRLFLDEVLFADAEAGVAEAAQGQLLQLADPLPGQVELVADLLEGARHAVVEPIAERQDTALSLREPVD